MAPRPWQLRVEGHSEGSGLPKFYVSLWHGLWAPRARPRKLWRREIFPREQQNPQALAALQAAEIEKWWPIIKAAGIKAE
jgi:hypothetical protein